MEDDDFGFLMPDDEILRIAMAMENEAQIAQQQQQAAPQQQQPEQVKASSPQIIATTKKKQPAIPKAVFVDMEAEVSDDDDSDIIDAESDSGSHTSDREFVVDDDDEVIDADESDDEEEENLALVNELEFRIKRLQKKLKAVKKTINVSKRKKKQEKVPVKRLRRVSSSSSDEE